MHYEFLETITHKTVEEKCVLCYSHREVAVLCTRMIRLLFSRHCKRLNSFLHQRVILSFSSNYLNDVNLPLSQNVNS